MTNFYTLRIHSRDVLISSGVTRHTGYELVEYDTNGVPLKISTVDLWNDNGIVRFDIKEQDVDLDLFQTTGIIHGAKVHFGDNSEYEVTENWLLENSYHTSPLLQANQGAIDTFNKIKLHAQVLNQFSDGINYIMTHRNCNSATQYFADNYLNGMNVFEHLNGVYAGSGYDFTKDKTGVISLTNDSVLRAGEIAEDIIACGAMDAFDNFVGLVPSSFNWSGFEITGYGSGYFMFSDGTKSYKVYDYDSNGTNLVTGSGNIIASSLGDFVKFGSLVENTTVYAGGGDDLITSAIPSLGVKNTVDMIYAGEGSDTIQVWRGTNHLFGEVGNDRFDLNGGDDCLLAA